MPSLFTAFFYFTKFIVAKATMNCKFYQSPSSPLGAEGHLLKF
jgi:hypothetical protein